MAKPKPPFFSLPQLLLILAVVSLFLARLHVVADSHFEGFEADDEEDLDSVPTEYLPLRSPPLTFSQPEPEPEPEPDPVPDPVPSDPAPEELQVPDSDPRKHPSSPTFEYWDEDEFEGLPIEPPSPETTTRTTTTSKSAAEDVKPSDPSSDSKASPETKKAGTSPRSSSYTVEIACGSFLIIFVINYFTGKRENENIALSWAAKFAANDSIFDKNFSLLGVGDGDDSPLLLKEGHNMFKFYASGRRYCQGLLATMELKCRHDLISRLYNMVVPCKDEISFEVYMNDEAMDHVVFAVAKKKAAKVMQKEVRDLQRFASVLSPPSGRKWVAEELAVISESKEVAGDLISEAVLDQVFGEKAFEKFRKGFISMHFSDEHLGTHKKMLLFKFALPDVNSMADMTRLVSLIPYYIDLVGRYKLSAQARSKTDAARAKAAQEAYKELQNARQDALQRKKAEKRRLLEEAEARLSAEAIRKKEAKERSRQMKKGMPRVKMTRAH